VPGRAAIRGAFNSDSASRAGGDRQRHQRCNVGCPFRGSVVGVLIMKRIEAVIRPHRLAESLAAIAKLRVAGVTVVDTVGFGRQPGHSEIYEETLRYEGMEMGLVPKKMLIMFVEDEHVATIVDLLTSMARTGYPGDGKIAVSSVDQYIRVREAG
jgi:nitrogen regulatory protein P-II 1